MDDNLAAFVTSGGAARWFARTYLRHIYGPPFDVHIANSQYTAAELRAALPDRPPGFIRVCGMGVDAAAFAPDRRDASLRASLQAETGGDTRTVLLYYAGRLSPEKNLGLLIDMMSHLTSRAEGDGRDYRLVVAGDGPARRAFEAEAARRCAGRVLCLGQVSDRVRLAALYASVDVFLHPNPREPFGIAPLEAMASGVAVVLPAAGGVLSYASDANAWLAAPDGPAFAAAVRRALQHPDPARLATALETARCHDWHEMASRYFAVLDDAHRARTCTEAGAPRLVDPDHQNPSHFHQPKPIVSHTAMLATET